MKLLAGFVAISLIGFILFVTNAFLGNPISAMLANKAIDNYVTQDYAFLDLEVEKAAYNFKYGSYMARATSKTSIDTTFAIYYRDGNVERDDYEAYVLGMFNTLQRLSEEYSTVAKRIVAEELGYINNHTTVMYNKDEYESTNDILELDMTFDKALPLVADVSIGVSVTYDSLADIAQVITLAHQAFVNNECNFNKYSLYAENDGTLVMISGVTPTDIESGELATRLEKAQMNPNVSDIYVYIKREQK